MIPDFRTVFTFFIMMYPVMDLSSHLSEVLNFLSFNIKIYFQRESNGSQSKGVTVQSVISRSTQWDAAGRPPKQGALEASRSDARDVSLFLLMQWNATTLTNDRSRRPWTYNTRSGLHPLASCSLLDEFNYLVECLQCHMGCPCLLETFTPLCYNNSTQVY